MSVQVQRQIVVIGINLVDAQNAAMLRREQDKGHRVRLLILSSPGGAYGLRVDEAVWSERAAQHPLAERMREALKHAITKTGAPTSSE